MATVATRLENGEKQNNDFIKKKKKRWQLTYALKMNSKQKIH